MAKHEKKKFHYKNGRAEDQKTCGDKITLHIPEENNKQNFNVTSGFWKVHIKLAGFDLCIFVVRGLTKKRADTLKKIIIWELAETHTFKNKNTSNWRQPLGAAVFIISRLI